MRVRKPSPALLVALLALFVALGGTSYAALKLPKNSVGAKQLKRNSVTSPKVKAGSLLLSDFKASERTALQGPQGPEGARGPQGTQGPQGVAGAPATKLWAKVSSTTPSFVRSSGTTGLEGPLAIGLTGVYRISFDQNVSGCMPVASISTADGGQPPAGQFGTNNSAANPNAIVVSTYNAAGAAVNTQDFTVAVFC
jgi:hypothetical protein